MRSENDDEDVSGREAFPEKERSGVGWGAVSVGLLGVDDTSSAPPAFTLPFPFALDLASAEETELLLSALPRAGCKTGLGGLAELKYLPPPGLEKKEE